MLPAMSDSTKLTRRGLFRGVGTAALVTGCVKRPETDGPDAGGVVSDTTTPAEIGPDPVPLQFTLNGRAVETSVEPRTTLLEALRIDLDTTGPKVVCDRGACSACLVMVDGMPRNSCLMLAHDVAGREVVTVEGLAALGPAAKAGSEVVGAEQLSALQEAFVRYDASQCGFCTSGMLVSCASLLQRHPKGEPLTERHVKDAIAGNLCRCGTYPHVVAAVLDAAGAKGGA